jgi:hypothetical protein
MMPYPNGTKVIAKNGSKLFKGEIQSEDTNNSTPEHPLYWVKVHHPDFPNNVLFWHFELEEDKT